MTKKQGKGEKNNIETESLKSLGGRKTAGDRRDVRKAWEEEVHGRPTAKVRTRP